MSEFEDYMIGAVVKFGAFEIKIVSKCELISGECEYVVAIVNENADLDLEDCKNQFKVTNFGIALANFYQL